MNRKTVAMRDPALAALVGAAPDDFGAEFGAFEFGDDAAMAVAGASNSAFHPNNQAAVQAVWNKAQQDAMLTMQRNRILEPNKGSSLKVERYAFCVNQDLELGTPSAVNATNQPNTTIRPQRISINAPAPGFMTVDNIQAANVSVVVGGTDDAWNYNANGVGQELDLPTLTPANRVTVTGNYTGFVPPGYVNGQDYKLVVCFKGPASITA